jgi:hypothetical protein
MRRSFASGYVGGGFLFSGYFFEELIASPGKAY